MADSVEFTEIAIRHYLDETITYWRAQRNAGVPHAPFYVDAFQSMRIALFGETLPEEEDVEGILGLT